MSSLAIKYLIFSILLHQHLVAMNSKGYKYYVKIPLFKFATFQCHCADSCIRKKENKKEKGGVGTNNCLLSFFISFYVICRIF